VKCSSCGSENPSEAKYCLRCGAPLGSQTSALGQPAQHSKSVLAHRTILSKILETPGTTLLTIAVAFIIISVVVGALDHLVAAIALFAIGLILTYFSVQLRSHETRAVSRGTEVREREIVKVKCRYCGALNPDGARNCGSCGAVL